MNGIILYPEIAKESAQLLGRVLGCGVMNPFNVQKRNFKEFDFVFNYGCNRKIQANNKINSASAVSRCKDKITTLNTFKAQGIPTVNFVTNKKDVPKKWKIIVGRSIIDGAENKGMEYFNQADKLPDMKLFTEWYDHKVEVRIIVYKGQVVGRYMKDRVKNQWLLQPVQKKGFSKIDKAAIKAANELKINFVGFDVLCKDQNNFAFLEANSAPIMTLEVANHIAKDLNNA